MKAVLSTVAWALGVAALLLFIIVMRGSGHGHGRRGSH